MYSPVTTHIGLPKESYDLSKEVEGDSSSQDHGPLITKSSSEYITYYSSIPYHLFNFNRQFKDSLIFNLFGKNYNQ